LDGEVVLPEPLPQPAQPHSASIERPVAAFLAELQDRRLRDPEIPPAPDQIHEFSITRGYAFIDQWQPTGVRDFRTSSAINPQTAASRVAMLKPFFEYCAANERMTRNPARLLKNPRGRDGGEKRAEQKLPLTDDELKRRARRGPSARRSRWPAVNLGPIHLNQRLRRRSSPDPSPRLSPKDATI
jgi:hypothetical protein